LTNPHLRSLEVSARPGNHGRRGHSLQLRPAHAIPRLNGHPLKDAEIEPAYLEALYHTQHGDKRQLLSLETSMAKDLAP
jgi:hypothetical protein